MGVVLDIVAVLAPFAAVLTPVILLANLAVNVRDSKRQSRREKAQDLDNKRADFRAHIVHREMPSSDRQRILHAHAIDVKNIGKAPARNVHVDFVDSSLEPQSPAKHHAIKSEHVEAGQVVRLPHFAGEYQDYGERSHEITVKWSDEIGENHQKTFTVLV